MKRLNYRKTYNEHYTRRKENRPVQVWMVPAADGTSSGICSPKGREHVKGAIPVHV